MRKLFIFVAFLMGLLFLNGCATDGVTTNVQSGNKNVNEIASYHGPKARIAVANFKCKAAKCYEGIGSGIKDMLIDSLFRSNRFIVLERGEAFNDVEKELEMENGELFNKKQGPRGGHLERADILVTGAIVAFEPNASGIGGGVGSVIGGILGGIGVKSKNAYIAADIRLIDVATGRIINSTRVEGKASSFSVGGLGGGLIGRVPLGGALRVYKNTPMEKAVMVMLDNAVREISRLVPEEYYRYSDTNQSLKSASYSKQPAPVRKSRKQFSSSGGIIGGEEKFIPGKRILFKENFSKYSIGSLPRRLHIKGQAEVAAFRGRKWLRALSKEVYAIKKIRLPRNFAVEWDIYCNKRVVGMGHAMFFGYPRGIFVNPGDSLIWASDWDYTRWGKQEIRKRKVLAGEIHHFAVQQRNGTITIFVDGHMIYKEPLGGGIAGKRLPDRNAVSFELWGDNPSEHKEVLITNIKITAYRR